VLIFLPTRRSAGRQKNPPTPEERAVFVGFVVSDRDATVVERVVLERETSLDGVARAFSTLGCGGLVERRGHGARFVCRVA
jgi:hypothetical protein